jgi:hypothetical protein
METRYISIETEEEDAEVFNELMALPELVEVLMEEADATKFLATVDSEALEDQTRMEAIFRRIEKVRGVRRVRFHKESS